MKHLSLLAVAALLLAGCASDDGDAKLDDAGDAAPVLEVTADTGGIRGVVVDEAIRVVERATVTLGSGETTQTDDSGLFFFTGLEPGNYAVQVSKPGFDSYLVNTVVVAGVAEPDILKITIIRIPGQEPYVQSVKFDGFYECVFGGNMEIFRITDACDFAYRTAIDGMNATVGNPANLPRTVQRGENTQFIQVGPGVATIIQEAFWDDPNVRDMMVLLSSTPIDNACDCSETDHIEIIGPSPTYGRIDGDDVPRGNLTAARGFLDWSGDMQYAFNLDFTVLTTMFHYYEPADGWTFGTQDQYPVG